MKKIISLLLVIVMTFTLSAATACSASVTVGDVTGDGLINSADALFVLRYTTGQKVELSKTAGDTDCDGQVDSKDALIILQFTVGLYSSLPVTQSSALLKIHYLDVGQGDSEFIELPGGKTMLIDAGESKYGDTVINYIKALNYTRLDYVIATHPHSDHIGGMKKVIEAFDVGEIYMPKATTDTKTYEKLLTAIADKGLKIKTAKAGVQMFANGGLSADFIAPNSDKYSDLNNYSAVLMLTYSNNKFLFMGDAQTESEEEISADVKCDIIKIGHHGSTTSSGSQFVNRVRAEYAVIEVGAENTYNHPNQAVIERWQNIGATVFRTDLNGTVTAVSDGKSFTVTPEKQ